MRVTASMHHIFFFSKILHAKKLTMGSGENISSPRHLLHNSFPRQVSTVSLLFSAPPETTLCLYNPFSQNTIFVILRKVVSKRGGIPGFHRNILADPDADPGISHWYI